MADPEMEMATLATAVTAMLIAAGGQLTFTDDAWRAAVDHEGSIFVTPRDDGKVVLLVLMNKVADA